MSSPVIFVHGIEGSWLKNHYPVEYQNEIYWDAVFNKQYDRLRLDTRNLEVDQGPQYFIFPHQTIGLVYAGLVNEIRQDISPSCYVFTYDWRKDNRVSARQLAAFIDLVIAKSKAGDPGATGKVSLVGHSMGGLVIKWCVLHAMGEAAGEKIDRIVTVCTPYRGSLKAVEAILPGARNFFGQEHDKSMRVAARTFPGLYQLLPSYPGAARAKDGLELDLFDQNNWQKSLLEAFADETMYPKGYFQGRLDDAKAFATETAGPYPEAIEDRFGYIYGVGSDSWRTVKVDRAKGNEFDFGDVVSDDQGDGTVHRSSAEIAGKTPLHIDAKELVDLLIGQHANATTHHAVQDAVVEALREEKGGHRAFASPR